MGDDTRVVKVVKTINTGVQQNHFSQGQAQVGNPVQGTPIQNNIGAPVQVNTVNNVNQNPNNVYVAKPMAFGTVRQVPINSQDAVNMARQQQNMQQQVMPVQSSGIVMMPINQNPEENMNNQQGIAQAMPMMNDTQNPGTYSQQDVDMVNGVNDLVKVVDVKYQKKTVIIMVAVIIVLILIFIIFEIPLLMEL